MSAAAEEVLTDALRLIAGERCETFTGGARCTDEGSGRERVAFYTADQWCRRCVAQDALDRADALPPAESAEPVGADLYPPLTAGQRAALTVGLLLLAALVLAFGIFVGFTP